MTRTCCAALAALAVVSTAAAETAVRTVVALGEPRPCNAPMSVAMLGHAYYRQPEVALTETVNQLLDTCYLSGTITTRYAILLFTARPTAEGRLVVVHLVYDAARRTVTSQPALLGAVAATWIYLSDDKNDEAVVQLSSVEVQNPILGPLGRLASTIVPKLRGDAPVRLAEPYPVYASVSPPTSLPFRRATIAETDFVSQGKAQIEGTAALHNQPRTWLTVNAGAGVFVGATGGAAQVKIDNKTYVSDPPARGAMFVGVTVHAPYDATAATPSRAERFGVVAAAVLTPSLGLYAGPSVGWRGLSVTAGVAGMFVNVPPPPKQINDPVENHESLATGRAVRVLVAVSYAFGG